MTKRPLDTDDEESLVRRVSARVEPVPDEKDLLTRLFEHDAPLVRTEIQSHLYPAALLALSLVGRSMHSLLALGPSPFTAVQVFSDCVGWYMITELPPRDPMSPVFRLNAFRYVDVAVRQGVKLPQLVALLGVLYPAGLPIEPLIRAWPVNLREELLVELVAPLITEGWACYSAAFYCGFRSLFRTLVHQRSTLLLREASRRRITQALADVRVVDPVDDAFSLLTLSWGFIGNDAVFAMVFSRPTTGCPEYLIQRGVIIAPANFNTVVVLPVSRLYEEHLKRLDDIGISTYRTCLNFAEAPFLWDAQLDAVFPWRWHVSHMTPEQLETYKRKVWERAGALSEDRRFWYVQERARALDRVLTPPIASHGDSAAAPSGGV